MTTSINFVDSRGIRQNMAGPIMDASVLTYEGISIVPTESYLDFTEPAWVLGKHFLLEDGT